MPKLTKRGQPGANSCSAGGVCAGGNQDFIFSIPAMQHIGCQSHLSIRVKKPQKERKKKKNVQPETVCTLILSSLSCLVSFNIFLFHFVLEVLSMWLLVVTGGGRINFWAVIFTCAWTIQHSVHTCWCCCSHVVFRGVILIPKSPYPSPNRPPRPFPNPSIKPLSINNPQHYPLPCYPLPKSQNVDVS